MFANSGIQYTNPMGENSFSSSHSANSSFSDGSPEAWESSTAYTPMSTPRRGSPKAFNYENSVFSAPKPTPSPNRYEAINGFCAMNTLTQNMMTLYHEPQPIVTGHPNLKSTPDQAMSDFNNYGPYLNDSMAQSFHSNHGLPMTTPALVHDDIYSPVSDMSTSPPILESCVVPSQTTFEEFGLQSPINPLKSLQMNIDFDYHSSNYYNVFSVDSLSPAGTRYLVPEYPQYRSEHSTPSRGSSNRKFSSQAQENNSFLDYRHKSEKERKQTKKIRFARKRSGGVRGIYDSMSTGIGLNPKASFTCAWPGCVKKFARSEHRKRHHKTHEDEKEKCEFCQHAFAKTRKDNYKTHLKLHADPKKGSRTPYHPGAAAALIRMEAETRKGVALKVKREGKIANRVARARF
ncbi:hypothetical protein BKA65DRAFT_292684 [Rhexocercosporidium sp. MPI-PUGE-AT-0058]|nr:hypothetical protein BKA65DRAFT_292684 [Rhexocercosporidium sp. MPI-PUGE-AT-0058]